MKQFLKNNLLSILVCLVTFAGLSYATTITRPYTSADYAGGAKAVGSKVNAEFDNIVNWLNGGNIASGNIAALGVDTVNIANEAVTTAKIADGAVTTVKIADGSVTNVKRGITNIGITSASSLFTNGGDFAQVTNLSTTITTNGRPVLIRLEAGGDTYLNSGTPTNTAWVGANNALGQASNITFVKNSSTLIKQPLQYIGSGGEALRPCSAYSHIDTPTAGSYTYAIGVESASGVTATVAGCRLTVTEF